MLGDGGIKPIGQARLTEDMPTVGKTDEGMRPYRGAQIIKENIHIRLPHLESADLAGDYIV